MTTTPEAIRIAIVLTGQESCQPVVTLPFSLEGYPPIEIVLFGATAEAGPDFPAHPLAELQLDRFDLVLDGQGLTGFSPQEAANLVAGPAARFFAGLVCQLQELRQRQEINTGIIHSATDGLITINEDHVIIGYNRGAEQMFGYTREEALGQDLKIIVPPPYKELHRQFVRRYGPPGEAHVLGRQRRITGQRRDGTEFPMSISFSVAEILGNLYFTGITRDITEYRELGRPVAPVRTSGPAVGSTVTDIAHEIKNPLLIIGGFARQLLKTSGLDDKTRKKLSIIAEEVSRLEEMVAEMRDFVHRPPAQKQPGQIAGVIQEVLDLFADTFKERHIMVRQVEEAPLPPFAFDPKQMHQVFLNLLQNALQAMPRGGEITITRKLRGNNVEISITDTGEGMAPEVLSNLFQPYFTTKEKGTGLGLAICQSIVQEHGGRLLADSTPGRGATFTVRLPLEEAAPA